MNILTIRSDHTEAELAIYSDHNLLSKIVWQAHRTLADTIHTKIDELLKDNKLDLKNLNGIVCFKGPGSFTGLRIGLTVANGLAQGLSVPVVGAEGQDWQADGVGKLIDGVDEHVVLPVYGGEVKITKPKK